MHETLRHMKSHSRELKPLDLAAHPVVHGALPFGYIFSTAVQRSFETENFVDDHELPSSKVVHEGDGTKPNLM